MRQRESTPEVNTTFHKNEKCDVRAPKRTQSQDMTYFDAMELFDCAKVFCRF